MTRKDTSRESGLAALEAALLLPVLAGFLFLLVEGGTAVGTYSSLCEASRVAARQVLLSGETDGAAQLVNSLLPDLDADALNTRVVLEDGGNTVTVEISYAYQTLFGDNPLGETHENLLTLVARTSMPMP